MSDSYWTKVLGQRVSRRGTMIAGGAATAAAIIAACGGKSSNSSGGGSSASSSSAASSGASSAAAQSTGLATKPLDTTAQAKMGGTWVLPHPEDPPNMDPLTTQFFGTNFQPHFAYSRLLKYKAGTIDAPPTGDVEGDAAESWELSPDKLQITFKLRPNLKFDPQPPVNGRAVSADDINWSWNTFSTKHVSRASFMNSLNADAPIISMQMPDDRTMVFKLARPYVPIVALFGVNRGFVVQPKEAEKQFDPRSSMHGTGPWMLTDYKPSVGMEYKRNPNYYRTDRPFIDNISRPIIVEYAQQVAQFDAGTVWQFDPRPEDLIPIRKRHEKMLLMATGWNDAYPTMLQFDWKANSPFMDERVRKAFSMLIDRDTWIETFNNVPAFKKEGINVQTRWHSHFSAGDSRYWLDPKGAKLGPGAANFKYDVQTAKQLLKAAGRDNHEFAMAFQSPAATTDQVAAFSDMFTSAGLKPTLKPLDRNTWTQQCHVGGGKWDGICADLAAGAGVDIDVWLDTRVRFQGSQYVPYTTPLDKIDELCKAQKIEFDNNKRTDLVMQIEKEMANQMVAIPYPGIAERYQLTWPWLANFGYIQSESGGYQAAESYVNYWYDASKKS